MIDLKYTLERTILICAEPDTVFGFFTDSQLFADWWGAGSQIEGRPGGSMKICYPNGITASGQVTEVDPGKRIVFTFGYDSGVPIAAGASRVTITLKAAHNGTEVTLFHEFADDKVRDHHIQGWRYQLALFANVASKHQHSPLESQIDSYFAMWSQPDIAARKQTMDQILTPDVSFQDAYSSTAGADDLNAHLTGAQQFMPGISLVREGNIHLCQDTALAHWVARKKDGSEMARGVNVFHLTADNRIRRITGFWLPKQS